MNETREYFNEVAGDWESMRKQFFGEGVRRAAIAAAGVEPGLTVIDVGTGTGFLAEAAIEAGARVIGVDLSEGMLAQVTARLAGKPFEARLSEPASLPLRDAEADAVIANMFLHHAEDPPAAICEMARALKPGGRLVITDADTHTHEWLRVEQHDRWLGFDRADIASWFTAAGLERVTVGDTREICSPTSTCGTKAAITIFLARGIKR
ncbi:MAG TPA: class I SAM-dependent methyltransferase [Vicinamibacterales bacterium]|nr:class I SAM-dependent methyltransferase [Vicinamibacterales bacterium]